MKGGNFSNVPSLIQMVFIGVRHPDLLIVRNFLFLDRQLSIKKGETLFHYFLFMLRILYSYPIIKSENSQRLYITRHTRTIQRHLSGCNLMNNNDDDKKFSCLFFRSELNIFFLYPLHFQNSLPSFKFLTNPKLSSNRISSYHQSSIK